MASPLAAANTRRVGGVTYTLPTPAPTRRTTPPRSRRPQPTGGVDWLSVRERFASTPEAQRKRQEEEEGQAQAEQGGFWNTGLGKGLGVVIGNPITQAGLKPLSAFAIPGRAVVAGVEELVKAMPEDWERRVETLIRQSPGALNAIDEERNAGRSYTERVMDPTYGFGSIIKPSDNKWLNRTVGFTGDVVLDPLSYVGGAGARVLAKSAPRAAAAQEAAAVAGRLEGASGYARLALQGQLDQARRAEQALPFLETRLPTGRAARAEFLSRLSLTDPEALKALAPDIARAGERGLNVASPALREATGLTEPGLRVFDEVIPGTRTLAKGIAGATGAGRVLLNRARGADTFARGPIGIEDAMATLTRGQAQMDVPRAAALVQMTNLRRLGEGSMRGLGRGRMRNFYRASIQGKSQESIDEMVKAGEAAADPNDLNKLFEDLAGIYERVVGKKLDRRFLRPGDTYIPHMLTPAFRRMLNAVGDEDLMVKDFKKQAGIVTDDLLESSTHLERSRKLTPNVAKDGVVTPRTIKIGNKEITIATGSIDELNQELAKLFPGFRGKFYEDNPLKIAESYVDSLARQAGRDRMLKAFADSENQSVRRVEGPLAKALEERNRVLRTKGGHLNAAMENPQYTAGQATPTIRATEEMPEEVAGIRLKDFFASKTDEPATRARREFLTSGKAKTYVRAAKKDVRETRRAARTEIYSLRDRMRKDLTTEQAILDRDLKPLAANIEAMQYRLGQLKPQREQYHLELRAMMIAAKKDIADLEDAIAQIRRVFKGKRTREMNAVERKLRGMLDTLRAIEARAENAYQLGPARLRQEADERFEDLWRPVEEMRQQIKDREASFKRPVVGGRTVDDEAVAWAEQTLQRRFANFYDPQTLQTAMNRHRRVITDYERRVAKGQKISPAYQAKYEQAKRQIEDIGGRQRTQRMEAEWLELKDLRRRVGRTGANRGREPELVARRNLLEAAFKQGGEHGVRVRRAFEILDANREYQAAANTVLNSMRDDLRQLEGRVARQQEALITVLEEGQPNRWVVDVPGRPIQGLAAGQSRQARQVELPRDLGEAYLDAVYDPRKGRPAPYRPRTEEQAIADLRARADQIGNQLGGKVKEARFARESAEERLRGIRRGELDFEQQDVAERVAREQEEELFPVEVAKMDAEFERDLGLESYSKALRNIDEETTNTQYKLQEDLKSQKNMLERRRKTTTLVEKLDKTKGRRAGNEIRQSLDDVQEVARQNPLMDDKALNEAESLLGQHADELDRVAPTDLHARELDRLMKDAYNGRVPKVAISILNDQWKSMHRGALQRGDIIMEAELARRFKNIYEMSKEPKLFGRVFNAATNVFKTYATLSPGFHVRNALSAIFMNSSDGVDLATQLEGWVLWQKYMKHGEQWLRKQDRPIQEAFEASFGSGAGGRFTESGIAEGSDNRVLNAIMSNRATRFSQRQGERVEGGVRLGMALDSIRNGEGMEGALQRITRIHFDYGQVSQLDERAKRLIPFWTFMSRNLPMQVTQMWTKPRLYLQYNKLVNNFSEDDVDYTPAYWLKAGGFNTGLTAPDVTGGERMPVYAQPDLGFTRLDSDLQDIEDFLSGERPGAVLSNLNPLLTAPAEFYTKQDIFTGRKFDETDYEKVSGLMAPIIPIAKLLDQTNEQGQVSSNFLNAIRAVNPLMDRSARIAPQLTGGNEEGLRRQPESIARFLGIPVRTLTEKQRQSEYLRQLFEQQDEEARLRAMLRTAAGR